MTNTEKVAGLAMLLAISSASFYVGHTIGVRQALEWSQQAWAHVLSDSNVVPSGRVTIKTDGTARYRIYGVETGSDMREKPLRRLPRGQEGTYRDTQGYWWITDGEGKLVGY